MYGDLLAVFMQILVNLIQYWDIIDQSNQLSKLTNWLISRLAYEGVTKRQSPGLSCFSQSTMNIKLMFK